MLAAAAHLARGAPASFAVAGLFVDERDRDTSCVLLPHPEIHVVARFGASVPNGLDVYAMGARHRVHRKIFPRGQRTVSARLRLGASKVVLGVPASAFSGRVVALEELWGHAKARPLLDRLADARDTAGAALALESALAERLARAERPSPGAELALEAAERLATSSVNAVSADLGLSERHLRRVFRESVGVSPKTFAKLARFRRALRAAREDRRASWASIAAAAGYYDQAHLIAEFRAIAGVTPRALISELRAALLVG